MYKANELDMNKKVYIGMTADVLHHDHMNILEEADKDLIKIKEILELIPGTK